MSKVKKEINIFVKMKNFKKKKFNNCTVRNEYSKMIVYVWTNLCIYNIN